MKTNERLIIFDELETEAEVIERAKAYDDHDCKVCGEHFSTCVCDTEERYSLRDEGRNADGTGESYGERNS